MNYKDFFLALKRVFTFAGLNFFFKSQTLFEKFLFLIFVFSFFFSASALISKLYLKNTKAVPAEGGILVEGIVGTPKNLNPLYSILSEEDDSIVNLLFAPLFHIDNEKIIPQLAQNYEVLEEGRIFKLSLKENIFWSDGKEIGVDDIIFTIKTIQNPEAKSPLRISWFGVDVEKISEKEMMFILKNPSYVFLENLNLRPIPKHIFENIPAEHLALFSFNSNIISSGPYQLEKVERDKKTGRITFIRLKRNEKYFGKKPYLKKVIFRFFENENTLKRAIQKGEIDSFSLKDINEFSKFNKYHFTLNRYFGVFFNLDKKVFSEKEIRESLNLAINKEELLKNVGLNEKRDLNVPFYTISPFQSEFNLQKAKEILEKTGYQDKDGDNILEKITIKEPSFQFKNNLTVGNRGKEVEELQKCLSKDSEIYPEREITGYFGIKTKEAVIKFQEKYKDEILKPFNLEKGTGEIRGKTKEKLNQICFERKEEKIVLKFSLVTSEDPLLLRTAHNLKEQWEKLGVSLEPKIHKIDEIKRDIIPKKNYDSILFGEVLGKIPDFFPYWHSSQAGENGLNLSNYQNKEVDKILEELRKEFKEENRKEKLTKFEEILSQDLPFILLYNPPYTYFVSDKIKNIKTGNISLPSERFLNISEWYLKEKRIWKILK